MPYCPLICKCKHEENKYKHGLCKVLLILASCKHLPIRPSQKGESLQFVKN